VNPLKELLTGGFSGVVESIGGVLGKFITDPAEKLKAQVEMTKIATDYQVQLLQADRDVAVAQASVVVAEAKSESWLARNWRPLIMLEFGFVIGYNFVLAPIFSLHALPIPQDMWQLLKIGLGGYVFGRSAEKIVETAVPAIVARKTSPEAAAQ
jgi:hypothetical protein